MADVDDHQRHNAVAQTDALQYTGDAKRVYREKFSFAGIAEPFDAESDENDKESPPENLFDDLVRGPEVEFPKRNVSGNTYHEQEEREDQVTRSQAIPYGVAQRGIRNGASGIVYQNHAAYRNAA